MGSFHIVFFADSNKPCENNHECIHKSENLDAFTQKKVKSMALAQISLTLKVKKYNCKQEDADMNLKSFLEESYFNSTNIPISKN